MLTFPTTVSNSPVLAVGDSLVPHADSLSAAPVCAAATEIKSSTTDHNGHPTRRFVKRMSIDLIFDFKSTPPWAFQALSYKSEGLSY